MMLNNRPAISTKASRRLQYQAIPKRPTPYRCQNKTVKKPNVMLNNRPAVSSNTSSKRQYEARTGMLWEHIASIISAKQASQCCKYNRCYH